jgi:glycerol-3-phosphate dehydrogenase
MFRSLKVPFISCSKGTITANYLPPSHLHHNPQNHKKSHNSGQVIQSKNFMSEMLLQMYPHLKYCILSGPSFAQEMMQNQPTLVTVASYDREACNKV